MLSDHPLKWHPPTRSHRLQHDPYIICQTLMLVCSRSTVLRVLCSSHDSWRIRDEGQRQLVVAVPTGAAHGAGHTAKCLGLRLGPLEVKDAHQLLRAASEETVGVLWDIEGIEETGMK